jgi:hypothetical protein
MSALHCGAAQKVRLHHSADRGSSIEGASSEPGTTLPSTNVAIFEAAHMRFHGRLFSRTLQDDREPFVVRRRLEELGREPPQLVGIDVVRAGRSGGIS